jgi:hypothetical protein
MQRRRNGIIYRFFIGNTGQLNQAEVVGEYTGHAVGNLNRKARFAHPARPGQRHQLDRPAGEQIDQTGRFLLTAEKAAQDGRQSGLGCMGLDQGQGADLFG